MSFDIQEEMKALHLAAERKRKADLIEAAERGESDAAFALLRLAIECTRRADGSEARLHDAETQALTELVKRLGASLHAGCERDALELRSLATHLTSELGSYAKRANSFPDNFPPKFVPVLVETATPDEWKSAVRDQAAALGVNLPMNKTNARKGIETGRRDQRLRHFTDCLAQSLLAQRRGHSPYWRDNLELALKRRDVALPVERLSLMRRSLTKSELKVFILSLERLKIRRWKAAAVWLPLPLPGNLELWWRVAKAKLECCFGGSVDWFNDSRFRALASPEDLRALTSSEALAGIVRRVERSFIASMKAMLPR